LAAGPRLRLREELANRLDAAAQGLGVVLGIPALAAADLAAGRLVAPFSLHVPSRVAYYLVCPEAASERPEITAFRAWLLREVGEAAHTDVGATRR
jgi:LysR family glycine cleavage system transcriptional activator